MFTGSYLRGFALSLVLATATAWADNGDSAAVAWQKLISAGVIAAKNGNLKVGEEQLLKAVQEAGRFPSGDARLGTTFNTLGLIYKEEKKFGDAEKAFERALPILEKVYGSEAIDIANVNFNIASALMSQGRYESAIPFISKSRTIYEKTLGPKSGKAVAASCFLGEVYRNMKQFAEAESTLQQCADMREASGGVDNPELGEALYNLAQVYVHQGKWNLAEPRMKLAAKIRERTFGITSPEFAEALDAHATLLKAMGKDVEAKRAEAMVESIRRLTKK